MSQKAQSDNTGKEKKKSKPDNNGAVEYLAGFNFFFRQNLIYSFVFEVFEEGLNSFHCL